MSRHLNSKPPDRPSKVLFLESRHGVESLFTRGLRSGALATGADVEVIFLTDSEGMPRTEKDVRIELLEKQPDTICFLMDAPLDFKYIWDAPSLAAVDKISFWFDDYFRSPKTLAQPGIWSDWQKNHGVRVGIWDGYWRCQWKQHTGVDAFPIHLAADPRLLRPTAEPWKKEWSERAAFVGTVPSLRSLETFSGSFPAPLRRFLDEICAAMQTEPWPLRPYDLFNKCRSFTGDKYRRAIDAMLKDPTILALWNHVLWRWGKRVARLRGLAAIAQAGPIAVMSGHGTEAYAGEEELRSALPRGIDLVYADTREVAPSSWKALFRTGKFQVQITDPQSVEGGVPFRVFECAACAAPLLSDQRPELAALFRPDSGLFLASNEAALTETAARLFGTPKKELDEQARIYNQEFLVNHTWEARWRQLTDGREPRSQATPFSLMPRSSIAPSKSLQHQPA